MPKVTRKKTIPVPPETVYDAVSDPRRLPQWWPRVVRVEDVAGRPGNEWTRWTCVLAADSGRMLRLDYRCSDANRPGRYEWEHELEGTPFAQHLARQAIQIGIDPAQDGSRVTLTAVHALRGTAKLAGFAMKKGQRELLDAALERLADVVAGDGAVPPEGTGDGEEEAAE